MRRQLWNAGIFLFIIFMIFRTKHPILYWVFVQSFSFVIKDIYSSDLPLVIGEGSTGFISSMDNLPLSIGGGGSDAGSSSRPLPDLNLPAAAPEPVAPEQPDGPFIPDDVNQNHLMPAQERMEELGHRLSINSITKKLSRKEWGSIIAAQIVVEESIEAALVDDGYPPAAILNKRHQIRGHIFYPAGTCLTEKTYVGYVTSIGHLGTRASVPYKRVMKAIENHDLSII